MGLKGYKHTPEAIEKIRQAGRRPCSPETKAKISKAEKGRFFGWAVGGYKHSEASIQKMQKIHRGENGSNWQGNNVKYSGLHRWLRTNFKKTGTCEDCNKVKETGTQWALKKGFDYERKKENFFELCLSCHTEYDRQRNEKGQFI